MSCWAKVLIVSCLFGLGSCVARPNPIGPAELYWLLDRACYDGDEIAVKMLLKAGADPTGVHGYDAFHQSTYQFGVNPSWPINQAASGGHTAVIRLLLAAGAKVDAPEDEGQTALMLAASGGDMATVRLLLEAGADKSYRAGPGSFEGTAADVASRAGHGEVSEFIRSFNAGK